MGLGQQERSAVVLRPALVLGTDHTVVPLEVLAQIGACAMKQLDFVKLAAVGLKQCCDNQGFEMPQPIVEALTAVCTASQDIANILTIIVQENQRKDGYD